MAKKEEASFEKSMKELETMIEDMESDQMPLTELITNYQRGAVLIAQCETQLNAAKKKLEHIILTPPTTSGENNSTTNQDEAAASDESNDDEIRLF